MEDSQNGMVPRQGEVVLQLPEHNSAPVQILTRVQPGLADEEPPSLWVQSWFLLRSQKGTLALIAFLGTLAGILFTLPQTPIYRARTSLEIQGFNENFLNMKEVDPNDGNSSGESYIQTQLKILQSEALTDRILDRLRLQERPEFSYPRDRISTWRKALGLSPKKISRDEAARTASSDLKVRASRGTRIVEVFCESPDPQLAADYANTLADEFIERNLETRWQSTQRTSKWLTSQLQDLQIKLEKSEGALQAYARNTGLVYTSEKENLAEEKLRQVQEELSKAQADRMGKQSSYDMLAAAPPESLPEVLNDPSLRDYQSKMTNLRGQLADVNTLYGAEHYKVKQLVAQIKELEGALERERGNVLKRIQNEYLTAQARENRLAVAYASQAKLVSEQAENAIHYNILKREVETNRNLYESVLQKVKESGVASAMRASNISVVDRAKTPAAPYKPSLTSNAFVGLTGGLCFGIMFVVLRERADRSIQKPGDTPFYLNVPELGVIPSAGLHSGRRLWGTRKLLSSSSKSQHKVRLSVGKVELVVWQDKPSLIAESFRTTLTSILFSAKQKQRTRVIEVTSPCAQEGKSTVTSNLGIALAEINQRVLLIDGDMRRPKLHDSFGVPNNWGLSDLLCWNKSFDLWEAQDLTRETQIPGLFVLPSGAPRNNTISLLHSPRMQDLLNRLRSQFDMVLIDTPPMLQMSDARVLGRLTDGVILVIRAGQTTRNAAVAAWQRFAEDNTPVLGTVLNDWDPSTTAQGHGYEYYDSYYRYYSGQKANVAGLAGPQPGIF